MTFNIFQGLEEYLEKYGDSGLGIADLYQNANHRPRKGNLEVPALTRGCKRLYIVKSKRFAHGVELLLLQGIPVTEQAAAAMRTKRVKVESISHSAQCSLAGNAMHSCCVGLMCVALLFVKVCGQ